MPTIITFRTQEHYILLPILVTTASGEQHSFKGLLDTGAPATEFSGESLQYAGLLNDRKANVLIKPGLQTQKYGKLQLHQIEICSQPINELTVYVAHFEKSWGIDALIGLDFFRLFRVTIDYEKGHLLTEPFQLAA